jgi:hypothetical protein
MPLLEVRQGREEMHMEKANAHSASAQPRQSVVESILDALSEAGRVVILHDPAADGFRPPQA